MNRPLSGLVVALCLATLTPVSGFAEPERDHRQEHFDVRHGHNQYYPNRGVEIRGVPRDARFFDYRGARYWFSGGVWYRPRGPRFLVVAPPVGIYVPIIPALATALINGGLQYYYANETYYLYHPDVGQYEVVDPPPGAVGPGGPGGQPGAAMTGSPGSPSGSVFVYPKNGQNPEQQARDRYECHRWAVDQTGFDPTSAGGGASPAEAPARRADYQRAQQACLEGRGYTVR
jgi:hypothetical protein